MIKSVSESAQRTTNLIENRAMKHAHKMRRIRSLHEEKVGVCEDDEYRSRRTSLARSNSIRVKSRGRAESLFRKYARKFHGEMHIKDRGISLKGLKTILAEYLHNKESFATAKKESNQFNDLIDCSNGENLVNMIVKPETTHNFCYIELLYGLYHKSSIEDVWTTQEADRLIGELDETLGAVNVFISHSWQYDFEMLVDSVEQWEKNWEKQNKKEHATFFYFLDYFAVNQHNSDDDLRKMMDVIKKAKVTCLILSPWDNPKPLLRSWCIFEIVHTELSPSTRLSVAFPPKEKELFKKKFFGSKSVGKISNIFEKIDSKNASSKFKEDKDRIELEIQTKLGGFKKVNELCLRNIRKWFIEQACEFADEWVQWGKLEHNDLLKDWHKAWRCLKSVGTFLTHQGKFEKSAKYLHHGRRMIEHLCSVKIDEKEQESREEGAVHDQAYKQIQAWAEEKMSDVEERNKLKACYLSLLNSLANALTEDQQFLEAERIYRKALNWRIELLSPSHKDSKMTQFKLGVCLIRSRKYQEAEELLEDVLCRWEKDTKYYWWVLLNLGDLRSKTGHPEEAVKGFEDSCKGLRDVGVDMRDRWISLTNIFWAKHLLRYAMRSENEESKESMLVDAQRMAENAYNNFVHRQGVNHPDTRLAARTQRRLELMMNPNESVDEHNLRQKLMKESYSRTWFGQVSEGREDRIRVMHWNVLADKLAYPDLKKGGFGCSYELLDWEKCRKDKIIAEIIKYKPDIFVLVELDHYEDIRIILQEDWGYKSVWKKKNNSFFDDGTGIFWKNNRFKVGKIVKRVLAKDLGSRIEADQVFVAVELIPKENIIPFVIAGCHLKSTKQSIGEIKRLDQSKQIIKMLASEFPNRSVILAADLNAEADCEKYKSLAYPYLNEILPSAYKHLKGEEPVFTSWKFRIDEDNRLPRLGQEEKTNFVEYKYTVDYIFHSPNLKTTAVLEVPEEKEIDKGYGRLWANESEITKARERCLLPNEQCPSDHLPIVAEIMLPSHKELDEG